VPDSANLQIVNTLELKKRKLVAYVIQVTNLGPSNMDKIVLRDRLADSITLQEVISPQATCVVKGNEIVVCKLPTLLPNESITIRLNVSVPKNTSVGNCATVRAKSNGLKLSKQQSCVDFTRLHRHKTSRNLGGLLPISWEGAIRQMMQTLAIGWLHQRTVIQN